MASNPERPLTHDLVRSIIGQTGNRVDRIVIGDMRDEVYYATIYMDGGRYTIDSRPSDAIALAMGMNVPIYVNDKLFESAPTIGLGGGKIPDTAHALGLTVEQMTPDLASAFGAARRARRAGVGGGFVGAKGGSRARRYRDQGGRSPDHGARRFQPADCEGQERRRDVDAESRRLEPHRHAWPLTAARARRDSRRASA